MSQPLGRLASWVGCAAAATAIILSSQTATAAPCAPHDEVAGLLAKNHQEKQQAIGLTGNGQLLEIFVSQAGTWTAVVSTPSGQSCITAAGEGWENRLVNFAPET
jgi:hypothetical protein